MSYTHVTIEHMWHLSLSLQMGGGINNSGFQNLKQLNKHWNYKIQ